MDNAFWARDKVAPAINYDLVRMIQALDAPQPWPATKAISPASFLDTNTWIFLQEDNLHTRTLSWKWDDGVVVVMGGTSGQHFNTLIYGWAQYNQQATTYGSNLAFVYGCDAIFNQLPGNWFVGQKKCYIVGHSYGGAIAHEMAMRLKTALSPDVLQVFTYGSPRQGSAFLQQFFSAVNSIRWYADNDPVRQVPPHTPESPAIHYLVPSQLSLGMNAQVQCPNGWMITPQGTVGEFEDSPPLPQSFGLSLLAWLSGSAAFGSVSHPIQNYIDRFNTYLGVDVLPVVPATRPRPEEPTTLRTRDQRVYDAQAVTQITADASSPTGVSAQYAVPRKPPGSQLVFRAAKFERQWVVALGDEIVSAAQGKRNAKQLARRFNRAYNS